MKTKKVIFPSQITLVVNRKNLKDIGPVKNIFMELVKLWMKKRGLPMLDQFSNPMYKAFSAASLEVTQFDPRVAPRKRCLHNGFTALYVSGKGNEEAIAAINRFYKDAQVGSLDHQAFQKVIKLVGDSEYVLVYNILPPMNGLPRPYDVVHDTVDAQLVELRARTAQLEQLNKQHNELSHYVHKSFDEFAETFNHYIRAHAEKLLRFSPNYWAKAVQLPELGRGRVAIRLPEEGQSVVYFTFELAGAYGVNLQKFASIEMVAKWVQNLIHSKTPKKELDAWINRGWVTPIK